MADTSHLNLSRTAAERRDASAAALAITEEEAAAAAAARLAANQAAALTKAKNQIERWVNAQSQIDTASGQESATSMLRQSATKVAASALAEGDRAALIAELTAAGYTASVSVGGAIDISVPPAE